MKCERCGVEIRSAGALAQHMRSCRRAPLPDEILTRIKAGETMGEIAKSCGVALPFISALAKRSTLYDYESGSCTRCGCVLSGVAITAHPPLCDRVPLPDDLVEMVASGGHNIRGLAAKFKVSSNFIRTRLGLSDKFEPRMVTHYNTNKRRALTRLCRVCEIRLACVAVAKDGTRCAVCAGEEERSYKKSVVDVYFDISNNIRLSNMSLEVVEV